MKKNLVSLTTIDGVVAEAAPRPLHCIGTWSTARWQVNPVPRTLRHAMPALIDRHGAILLTAPAPLLMRITSEGLLPLPQFRCW